ncbi:Asd/ArgC dimerization domain-containing protein [Celerinatantimonas yamalensis]|uniref:Asd/ArgC dimerization domain-containing protein n=1 Tax=Celerinatantimonas yamalensis TaxID=559956 RepID=A0ABW9G2D4_9GAMM
MAIAVLGASSLLGKALIERLVRNRYPVEAIVAVDHFTEHDDDSDENDDRQLDIADQSFELSSPDAFDWGAVQVVIGCEPQLVQDYADEAVSFGAVLLNATNTEMLGAVSTLSLADSEWVGAQGVYQVPNATVLLLSHLLERLDNEVGLETIHISVLNSVSDQGQSGISELAGQTARLLNGLPVEPEVYAKQVAFNLLNNSSEGASTAEAVEQQLPLVFRDSTPVIMAHSVTVPVFYGTMALVSMQYTGVLSVAECADIWQALEGVELHLDQLVTLVTDLNQQPYLSVTELRQSAQQPHQLKFCVQADTIYACVVPYLEKLIQRISGN